MHNHNDIFNQPITEIRLNDFLRYQDPVWRRDGTGRAYKDGYTWVIARVDGLSKKKDKAICRVFDCDVKARDTKSYKEIDWLYRYAKKSRKPNDGQVLCSKSDLDLSVWRARTKDSNRKTLMDQITPLAIQEAIDHNDMAEAKMEDRVQ